MTRRVGSAGSAHHFTRRAAVGGVLGTAGLVLADGVACAQVNSESRTVAPSDVADPQIRRFYELRGWRAAWTAASELDLAASLLRAERHAIEPLDLAAYLDSELSPSSRDVRLTEVAMGFAAILSRGAVDPKSVNDVYTLPRNGPDLVAGLSDAVARNDTAGWLDSLAPGNAEYGALSAQYLIERRSFGELLPQVDGGGVLREGDSEPRIESVRRALQKRGYLEIEPGITATTLFTASIAAAVRRLQADEGLERDGVIGPDTLWALNRGPADRARQLAINLERWRWLQRTPPPSRIDVNTAAAELTYVRDGAASPPRRVVVGRRDWATPSLGASFDRLVVNPPWNVPLSIARREILPRGSAYLRRNNMVLRNGRVVQRPGPDSALGLVKFDMRNPYAIYLHDTPAKAVFDADERHRSHGCVRVEGAVAFARRLAEERGRGAEFDVALQSGRTTFLSLGSSIEVRLLYLTAFVRDGRVVYAPDPYGRDDRLAKALGMPAAKRPSRKRYSVIPFGP